MADVEEEEAPEGEADEVAEVQPTDEAEKAEDEAPQELEEGEEEDVLDEAEVDPFEMLDEDSEDNEEEERMYREYLALTKEIDCQNKVINDLRERSYDLSGKPCQTRREKDEYKKLRIRIDKEHIKLNEMMNRAVQLQNNGSKRIYGNLELATTSYDENLFMNSSVCVKEIKCPASTSRAKTAQQICDALDNSDTDTDTDSDDCCF